MSQSAYRTWRREEYTKESLIDDGFFNESGFREALRQIAKVTPREGRGSIVDLSKTVLDLCDYNTHYDPDTAEGREIEPKIAAILRIYPEIAKEEGWVLIGSSGFAYAGERMERDETSDGRAASDADSMPIPF